MQFESKAHHHAWYETTLAGRTYAYASEAASEADRVWFEAHPTAFCYVRVRQENELPPDPLEAVNNMMLVAQITPGFRMCFPTTEANVELAMARAAQAATHFRALLPTELAPGVMPVAQSRQQFRKTQRKADKAMQRPQKKKGARP